jgi:hypothetical protein
MITGASVETRSRYEAEALAPRLNNVPSVPAPPYIFHFVQMLPVASY